MKLFFGSLLLLAACAAEDELSSPAPLCPCMPGRTYTCHCPEDGVDASVQTGSRFCTKDQHLTWCVCQSDRYELPADGVR